MNITLRMKRKKKNLKEKRKEGIVLETYEPISKTLGYISDEKHKVSFLCVYFCRLFCFFDIRIFKVNYVVGNKCTGAF